MRRLLPLAIYFGLAAVITAAAIAGVGGEPRARAATVAAAGAFSISDSQEGLPVFGANGIAPGDSTQGTVEIANTGEVEADLLLERRDLLDTPGLGGGVLSSQLQLRVEDVTEPATPALVYAGPLGSMPAQQAGQLKPGETRTYEFTATLPETEADQNELQGATMTAAYSWTASEAGEGGGESGIPISPGSTGGGSGGTTGGGNGGSETVAGKERLDLTVPKIRRALRAGRFVTLTDCNEPCRLSIRGQVRARGVGTHRAAKIRFAKSRVFAPGKQRLRVPLPRALRRYLRETPGRERLRAKLRFVAVGTDGERDAVRKTAKLRASRG